MRTNLTIGILGNLNSFQFAKDPNSQPAVLYKMFCTKIYGTTDYFGFDKGLY